MIKSFNTPAMQARRAQAGITLIEVSIGLIIAAIIAAAAFIAFQNNSRRAETQDNIKQITEVISETKQKFGIPTGYTPAGNTAAVDLRPLAANVGIFDVAAPVNSYGGTIALSGINPNTAALAWPSVDQEQCTDIVLNSADGVIAITSAAAGAAPGITAAPTTASARAYLSTTPMTLAAADALCDPGANNETVGLAFFFGRR